MRSQNRPCSDSRAATQIWWMQILVFWLIFCLKKGRGGYFKRNILSRVYSRSLILVCGEESIKTWGSGRGGGGLAPVVFGPWDEQACQSDSADAAHGDDDVGDCNNDHNKDQILEITTMSRNSDWDFVKTISQTFVCSLVMFRRSWQSEDIHNPPGRNPNC